MSRAWRIQYIHNRNTLVERFKRMLREDIPQARLWFATVDGVRGAVHRWMIE